MSDFLSRISQTLFGVSRGLDMAEQAEIRDYLKAAWRAQYGRPPATLSVDLETLSDLFRSHVQAKRVRDAAEDLRAIGMRRPILPEIVFLPIDDLRGFVTPEGRVLLEQLEARNADDSRIMTREDLLFSYAVIAEFYGDSQRRWMKKEIAGGNVRPGSLGFAVFLLINNSVGPNRSLVLPSSQKDEEALAKTVLPVVSAFIVAIGSGPVAPRESERLRSNWLVTETKRQLPRFISRNDDGSAVRYWINPESESDLLDELGVRLAARKGVTYDTLLEAFDVTLRRYELARPMLASWDLAYERSAHTHQVIDGVMRAYTRSVRA